MSFPARYKGKCSGCGDNIQVGDIISLLTKDQGGVLCSACVDDPPWPQAYPASNPRLTPHSHSHPVCSRCWLTHPPGEEYCDR